MKALAGADSGAAGLDDDDGRVAEVVAAHRSTLGEWRKGRVSASERRVQTRPRARGQTSAQRFGGSNTGKDRADEKWWVCKARIDEKLQRKLCELKYSCLSREILPSSWSFRFLRAPTRVFFIPTFLWPIPSAIHEAGLFEPFETRGKRVVSNAWSWRLLGHSRVNHLLWSRDLLPAFWLAWPNDVVVDHRTASQVDGRQIREWYCRLLFLFVLCSGYLSIHSSPLPPIGLGSCWRLPPCRWMHWWTQKCIHGYWLWWKWLEVHSLGWTWAPKWTN